ncbi:MAG: hypothetical protein EZS28_048949, partial [Streblomastix strix]
SEVIPTVFDLKLNEVRSIGQSQSEYQLSISSKAVSPNQTPSSQKTRPAIPKLNFDPTAEKRFKKI